MKLEEQFKKWLKIKHLEDCFQCQQEGAARLVDVNHMAYRLFKAFMETRRQNASAKIIGKYANEE